MSGVSISFAAFGLAGQQPSWLKDRAVRVGSLRQAPAGPSEARGVQSWAQRCALLTREVQSWAFGYKPRRLLQDCSRLWGNWARSAVGRGCR
jgi:hypothetical protein